MSYWLEEAESKISKKNYEKTTLKDRIEVKKVEVKENRILIENDFEEIIERFISLIERINHLPRQYRIPFGIIHSKQKNNRLNNLMYKFSSSRRISSKEFKSILKPYFTQHYKNTRSLFISISRKKNHLLLEYKEVKAKRIRINEEEDSFWRKLPFFKSSKNKENITVTHEVKNLPIDGFHDEMIRDHIDWLAFKNESVLLKQTG